MFLFIIALIVAIIGARIAEQREATAEKEASANRKLADSVSKDPNVLVSNCLNLLGEMVDKGQPVPAGFSCWPGGGASSVIVGK